jgi:hypothetical protein
MLWDYLKTLIMLRLTIRHVVGPISLLSELPPARKVCQRCLAASFRLTS